MTKVVFIDYTGTMVRADDPYTLELVDTFTSNSDLKDRAKALEVVWDLIKKIEWEHYQDTFIGKDEMVDKILDHCVRHYNLSADLDHMHEVWRNSWIHAPLFDDVKPFVEACPLPIYVVTNDDLSYINQSLAEKELEVAGVISAEMVRANKPHIEILEEALRVAGVAPEEAVLIGDSETSDVCCAKELGITPILLDRWGISRRTDIRVIRSLTEF